MHLSRGTSRYCAVLLLLVVIGSSLCFAQSETATVAGQVSDPSGFNIAGAELNLVDIDHGTTTSAKTDKSGFYRFASVHPGRYRIEVRAEGFRVINLTDLVVNVQDHLEQNFKLALGSISERVAHRADLGRQHGDDKDFPRRVRAIRTI